MEERGSWTENTCRLGATCLRRWHSSAHIQLQNLIIFKNKTPRQVLSPREGSGSRGVRARTWIRAPSRPKPHPQAPQSSWGSESPGCSGPGRHPAVLVGPGGCPQLHRAQQDHADSTTKALLFILPAPPYPHAGPESIFQLKINHNNNNNKPINPKSAPHQHRHGVHPSCRDRGGATAPKPPYFPPNIAATSKGLR